ncbi:MAG TPA: class I SAM-dependent methyltransferase [Erythrobacter sp.]|nr:class I SAM-dependent methyltransferase [Erythrobacter sp.]
MNDAVAWSDFWAANTKVGGRGCMPQRWAAIEDAQQLAWRGFIANLPQAARVLDLATGDGRVLGWMRAEREDLTLIGVDLAPTLPEPPHGTETRGGVPMEALPFDTNEFTAVVSQFGFEYGDVAKTPAEIARVLASGGVVGLMVHRGDGPILEHNRTRQAGIDWVLVEQRLGKVMTEALVSPQGGPQVAAQVAAVFARLGADRFGQNSPAWEIPEAMRRAVLLGANAGVESITATLHDIEARAQNEIGRIASLTRACAVADQRDTITAAFSAQGLELREESMIAEPSGRAIASFLTFS